MCLFAVVTRLLILINGTLCPAFHTYKSLDKEREEFLAWSKYWIIYALLICLEQVVDIFFSWMPLYIPSKLLLVLWIVLAAPQASVWVYDAIVGPLLSKRQQQIDNFLLHGRKRFFNDCLAISSQLMPRSLEIIMPVLMYFWIKVKARLTQEKDQKSQCQSIPEADPEPLPLEAQGSSIYSSLSNSGISLSGSESSNELQQMETEVSQSIAKTRLQAPMLAPEPLMESSKQSLVQLAKKKVNMNVPMRRGQRKQLRTPNIPLMQEITETIQDEDEDKLMSEDEFRLDHFRLS